MVWCIRHIQYSTILNNRTGIIIGTVRVDINENDEN